MPQIFASDKQKKPESIGALTKISNSTVQLAPSTIHFNSTATFNGVLENTANITCDLSTSGAGGLDTGAEAASTYYQIYAVNNSGVLALVASTSASPSGFSEYKWLGVAVNDGSSNIEAVTNKMTLTKLTSGSGTYNVPLNVKKLRIKMAGGGGGGSAVNGATPTAGSAGGATTFGTSLLTANGGNPGSSAQGGAGGTATVNLPAIEIAALTGGAGSGQGRSNAASNDAIDSGGNGGTNPFGGNGGMAGWGGANGSAGSPSTGAGGGGGAASYATSTTGGPGGGAGGYVEAIIYSPNTSYSYSVGAGGAGGNVTYDGGAGGSGVIIIEEYYN